MWALILLVCSSIFGFVLFKKIRLFYQDIFSDMDFRASVIIPARNEENNLPFLLESLKSQTIQPYEIIVVDDFSSDRTSEIAGMYGTKVIKNSELPENWTGKSWALWNGYKESKGDVLVFLDADVILEPEAIKTLLNTRSRIGGAISVVPYHRTQKFYERFSLILYLLGVFAFTSPFERRHKRKGLYGSCIVVSKEDYEKISGHDSIKSEVLDDLNLGKKLSEAGVHIENFIGYHFVSFRMYPNGLLSELQGFGKGAVLSTSTLRPLTVVCIVIWLIGLWAVEFITPILLLHSSRYVIPFIIGYILYTLQIIYILKFSGKYGKIIPIFHLISSIFFVVVILYSYYQVIFIKSVSWKGRRVKVGGK